MLHECHLAVFIQLGHFCLWSPSTCKASQPVPSDQFTRFVSDALFCIQQFCIIFSIGLFHFIIHFVNYMLLNIPVVTTCPPFYLSYKLIIHNKIPRQLYFIHPADCGNQFTCFVSLCIAKLFTCKLHIIKVLPYTYIFTLQQVFPTNSLAV